MKTHRCQRGWASPGKRKAEGAPRRHCDHRAELSPAKTLVHVAVTSSDHHAFLLMIIRMGAGASYGVTRHRRVSRHPGKDREVQHNPDRRRERR